jgi:hypothetical protein
MDGILLEVKPFAHVIGIKKATQNLMGLVHVSEDACNNNLEFVI